MSDQNGVPEHIGSLVKKVREGLQVRSDQLLVDLGNDHGYLRQFLVGGEYDGETWPAGTITIRRDERDIVVTLRWPTLGMETHYRDVSWCDLWERIDNDLDSNTVPWQPDYQTRRKEQQRLNIWENGS